MPYINHCWSAQGGGILMGCNTATKQDLPCKKSCDKQLQQQQHNESQTLRRMFPELMLKQAGFAVR